MPPKDEKTNDHPLPPGHPTMSRSQIRLIEGKLIVNLASHISPGPGLHLTRANCKPPLHWGPQDPGPVHKPPDKLLQEPLVTETENDPCSSQSVPGIGTPSVDSHSASLAAVSPKPKTENENANEQLAVEYVIPDSDIDSRDGHTKSMPPHVIISPTLQQHGAE